MNTFCVIYQKPQDNFLKSKEFFLTQRKQAINEIEQTNESENLDLTSNSNLDLESKNSKSSEEEKSDSNKGKPKIQEKSNTDDINFLGLDLDN